MLLARCAVQRSLQRFWQALIKGKADMRITNRHGESALHVASRKSRVKVVQIIVNLAVKEGMYEELISKEDNHGNTALRVAATPYTRSIINREDVSNRIMSSPDLAVSPLFPHTSVPCLIHEACSDRKM